MRGYLLLEGGAEFGGQMSEPDRRAIERAGGPSAQISIIPTAAAPDNNHQRAGRNGVNWFNSLGATQVESLPLIDKASANDPSIANAISQSRLIYMLGGFTGFLGETLKDSACWQAMLQAYSNGAVISGSKRRRASKKSRSVPGSRSAVVKAHVVWETKTEQRPLSVGATRRCVSMVSVISTISSFFFVVMVIVFIQA